MQWIGEGRVHQGWTLTSVILLECRLNHIYLGFLTNQVREGDMLLYCQCESRLIAQITDSLFCRHNVPTIRLQFRQQQRFEELVTILGDDRAERLACKLFEPILS